MADYAAAGPHRVRSATLLNAGLKYLADLRRNAEAEIAASDAHTLLRAIETLDLIDNGEIVMHGALERKESRGMHQRSDFTFTNPLLSDKMCIRDSPSRTFFMRSVCVAAITRTSTGIGR